MRAGRDAPRVDTYHNHIGDLRSDIPAWPRLYPAATALCDSRIPCKSQRRQRADTLVRGSSYLDVIESHPEWVGGPFVEEAEYLSDTNEKAWRWKYLGEIVGTGGAVFDNIREERLVDDRIRSFERVRNGVDWGWFPDPWRFVRCGWEPNARRLLVFEEHSANRMMPAETGRIVVDSLTFVDERDGGPTSTTRSCTATTRRTARCRWPRSGASLESGCTWRARPG